MTDGPFKETREQIAGYFPGHAHDLQGAISIAARFQERESAPSKSGK